MPSKGSWGASKEAADKQGGTFLRLENDGDKVVVAFCGAPLPRDITYNEKTKKYEAWNDESKAAGRKKSTRYALNAFLHREIQKKGKLVDVDKQLVNDMRVIDMNFATFTNVVALKDKYGFGKCLFEIQRHGVAGDTQTTYQILPDSELTPDLRAMCGTPDPKNDDNWFEGSCQLIDLDEATSKGGDDEDSQVADDVKKKGSKGGASGARAPAPAPAPAPAAPAPAAPAAAASPANDVISKSTATEMIDAIKALPDPQAAIKAFLAKFAYAKKVSDIKASDEAQLRDFVASLGPKPAQAEEDPFA